MCFDNELRLPEKRTGVNASGCPGFQIRVGSTWRCLGFTELRSFFTAPTSEKRQMANVTKNAYGRGRSAWNTEWGYIMLKISESRHGI